MSTISNKASITKTLLSLLSNSLKRFLHTTLSKKDQVAILLLGRRSQRTCIHQHQRKIILGLTPTAGLSKHGSHHLLKKFCQCKDLCHQTRWWTKICQRPHRDFKLRGQGQHGADNNRKIIIISFMTKWINKGLLSTLEFNRARCSKIQSNLHSMSAPLFKTPNRVKICLKT